MIDIFGQIRDLVFSKTIKDTSIILIGNVVASVLTIIFIVLAARFLGPEDWAILAAIISFIAIIAAFGDLGLSAGLFRFVSSHWANQEYSRARKLINILFSLRFISALLILFVVSVLSPLISQVVIKSLNPWLLILSAFGIFGSLLIDFQITNFETKRKWYIATLFISLTSFFRIIFAIITFYSGLITLELIVIIFAASPLLSFLISLLFEKIPKISFVGWTGAVRDITSFSGWMGINRIIGAVSSRLDIFLLLHLSTPLETGIFAAARQLAQGVPIILGSFATVLAPRFATYENDVLKRSFKKSILLSVLLSLGIVAGILLAGPVISLFGSKYIGSTIILQWLLVGLIPFALSTPMTNMLIYSFHKPKIIAILSMLQLPLIIIGNLYFIPIMGSLGAVLVFGLWNFSTLIVLSMFVWYYARGIK